MLRTFRSYVRFAVMLAHRMENAFYLLKVLCAVQWMIADIFAFVVHLGAVNENKRKKIAKEIIIYSVIFLLLIF